VTVGAAWPLVGRDEELDLLDAALADGTTGLVVAGPAGVGKSRLVAEHLDRARAAGRRTVLVRATRSTATIPFGPFAPWAPDAGTAAADRLQVLRSISTALVGGEGDSVVAIDDAHLLDEGSAALVLHLATDTPAQVVVTVRTGEPCRDAVVALWKEGLATRADLQALSEPETADLAGRALGGPLDPTAQARLWDLTRGVPLYLREVVRTARDQGVLVQEAGRWRWRGRLTGSDRLVELVRDNLARAAPDERRVLELVAFGEPLPLEIVRHLGHGDAAAGAEARGVLVADDADGGGVTLRLVHPLYTEVLRGEVPPLAARAHQAELARSAEATGWHRRDPLRVGLWSVEGDATLDDPAVLVAAARRALAVSEWALAERLSVAAGDLPEAVLTRAISLSPQLRWDEAMATLASVAVGSIEGDVGPELAGEVARIHSWLLTYRPDAPAPTLAEAVAATDRLPAGLRTLALVHTGFQAVLAGRPGDAAALAERVLADGAAGPVAAPAAAPPAPGPDAGDAPGDVAVQALAVLAFARAVQGRTAEALTAAERALPHVAAILAADPVPGNPAGGLPVAYCLALLLAGRAADARAVADLVHAGVGDHGPPALRALTAGLAGRMATFQGAVIDGRRLGELGLAICRETGQLPASQFPGAAYALAAAQMGDAGTAAWALAAIREAGAPGPIYGHETGLAEAWWSAAEGRSSDARGQAAATARRDGECGMHGLEVLALLELVRLGGAADAAPRLAAVADVVDGRLAPVVTAQAAARAAGDAPGLDTAAAELEGCGFLLAAAEAAAAAASAHHGAGRRGSEATARGRARSLAARCPGAHTPDLGDLGTDAALASLTGREREVAGLAARGLSNREIAEALFVSVRTVTTHLHRAYAKLGVNDRARLDALLNAGTASG